VKNIHIIRNTAKAKPVQKSVTAIMHAIFNYNKPAKASMVPEITPLPVHLQITHRPHRKLHNPIFCFRHKLNRAISNTVTNH
jgi:hypothetical protein